MTESNSKKNLEDYKKENAELKEKVVWFESILDAIPFPVSVTDMEMNWTYLNRSSAENLSFDTKQAIGTQCSRWNANICLTKNCGIECLRRGENETFFEQDGKNFKVDVSYIRDAQGNNVGHVEVIQDVTAVAKVVEYLKAEVKNVAEDLERIAVGNPDLKLEVGEADQYTQEVREHFVSINDSIGHARDAVMLVVNDSKMLAEAGINGRLDTRADAGRHQGVYRDVVDGVNGMMDSVIGPLNLAAEYVDRISKGDIPEKITDDLKGDFNEVKNNLNQCIDAVNNLVEDAGMLAEAGINGRLDTRADADRHQGSFCDVVAGVNGMMDSVIGPLNLAAEYVDRISKGDIPEKITDDLKGDFNEIKNNLNQCIDAVNNLVEDAGMLAEAGINGCLDTRADAGRHQGSFCDVVAGVNGMMNSVIGPLNLAAEYVDRISKGDIPEKITDDLKGDFNEVKNNLNQCIDAVNNLVEDAGMLADAGINGRLDTRADAGRHQGSFCDVVAGVNGMMDSVIGPLNLAAEYVDRISKGDIPEKITDDLKGDFNEIKNNLNQCIDAVNNLVEDAAVLADGAVEGHVDIRADASGHMGDFRKIVEGVNATLEAIEIPVKEITGVTQKLAVNDYTCRVEGGYKGTFAELADSVNGVHDTVARIQNMAVNVSNGNLSDLGELKSIGNGNGRASYNDHLVPAFIAMIETLNNFQVEFAKLQRYSKEGQLDKRGDSSGFDGAYAEVIEGVNDILDAILIPINEGNRILDQVAHGKIDELITRQYRGDHEAMKNNINGIALVLQAFEKELDVLIRAAADGDLRKRGDASKFEGAYAGVIEGANAIMEAIDVPVQETLRMAAAYEACRFDTRVGENVVVKGDFLKLKNALNNVGVAIGTTVGEIGRIADEFEKGHFDTRVDERLNVVGDIVAIKEGLNSVGDVVSTAFIDVKTAAGQVDVSSGEVSKGADQVAKAAEGVATTSQNTADLTKKLLEKMEAINTQIADLSASNEEIAGTAQTVLEGANDVVAVGKEAQASGDDAKQKMGKVEVIAKESVNEINALTDQIKEVNNVVKLINDIASQINLLALNAAIEAARAGEHGRGFAVVAGEVKNLAAEAREATGNIEKIVSAVQSNSVKTAEAINHVNMEVVDGVESVNVAIGALNKIITDAGQVSVDVGEIAKAIEDQAGIANNVVSVTEDGSTMTKEVQGQAEELAALAEEASASIEEIGSGIHEVNELAGGLNASMDKFRV